MPTIQTIYLGKLSIIDPTEGSSTGVNENASALLGTHGSAATPLSDNIVTVDILGNNPPLLTTDHNPSFIASSSIKFDPGSGNLTRTVDAIQTYRLTVKFSDGTSSSSLNLQLFQTTDGHTFIAARETLQNVFENKSIQSVSINSVPGTTSRTLGISQYDGTNFVCFAEGTYIMTDKGEVPVEKLGPRDRVFTVDHGHQEIIWSGQSTVSGLTNNMPYAIPKGFLGAKRDLLVSPQHRIFLKTGNSPNTEEIFVSAKHLAEFHSIRPRPTPEVTYYHILTKQHDILIANGVRAESLYPGKMSLRFLGTDQVQAIEMSLQERKRSITTYGPLARRHVRGRELKKLLEQGNQNYLRRAG
ncbi:Hint domain-containing protein [Halocynthiibacter sp.]|uniref:Hint domain-containing protein n=1 Tax=Halocynthiibacter sp. TaxID=1979210 RepID=UPI003C37EAF8